MSEEGWGDENNEDNGGGDGWSDNEDMPQEEGNDLENTFYHAEAIVGEHQQALEKFEFAVALAEGLDEYDYRFKSLMWIIYLSAKTKDFSKMEQNTQLLLNLMHRVAPNEVDVAINKVLDAFDSFLVDQPDLQSKLYSKILGTLKSQNATLWSQYSLKLAKMYLNTKNYDSLCSILQEIKDNCKVPGEEDKYDITKSKDLLDAFSLEIRMCQELKNNSRMKQVYNETQKLSSVINDPKVVAVIKETGGIIFLSEKKWDLALDELFESYKNYLEVGDFRAKAIFKYVILASILANSKINYATLREAATYYHDSEIMAITSLRTSFENNDINQIQKILKHRDSHILDDPIISMYLDDLLRSIRLNVIIAKIKPYKTVTLDFLQQQLSIPREEVCGLLAELILEERIRGQIDQLNGFLELSSDQLKSSTETVGNRHSELRRWAQSLSNVHSQLVAQLTIKSQM